MRALVECSVDKASRLYGLVYPRDVWWNRLGNGLLNLYLRLVRNPFRVFVHSELAVDGIIRAAGLQPRFRHLTPFWQVVVYSRAS